MFESWQALFKHEADVFILFILFFIYLFFFDEQTEQY